MRRIAILLLLDIFTTVIGYNFFGLQEQNILMREIVHSNAVLALIALKIIEYILIYLCLVFFAVQRNLKFMAWGYKTTIIILSFIVINNIFWMGYSVIA